MEILLQNKNRVKECSSGVEQLPSTHKVLGSIPNAEKKINQSINNKTQTVLAVLHFLFKSQLVFSKVGSLMVFGSVMGKAILQFLLALQARTGNVCLTLLHRCKGHPGSQSLWPQVDHGYVEGCQHKLTPAQGRANMLLKKLLKPRASELWVQQVHWAGRAYWTQYPLMDGLPSSHKQMHASPITSILASDSGEKVGRFPRPRPCEVW